MNGKRRFAAALLGSLCIATLTVSPAEAAEPDATAKADAAKRFDRGLSLFNEGDNAGALAEFKQVYATLPNPVVLYNIGLVYAAMGRPVDAVDALKQIVNDTALSPPQHERAQSTLADQEVRIGRLSITSIPPGARITLDGVDVATTPLTAPLRVSAGSHVVGAVAEGYALARKEVVVAGNADAQLGFELVRLEATRDANLTVRSRLGGAEVFINGKSAGKTPLSTSLSVPPGQLKVELRRPGYVTANAQLALAEGSTGEVSLDPSIDSQALSTEGVFFSLDVGRKNAELYVDQEHLGPYNGPVRLPKGPHRVRVEAVGFLPFERDVSLEGGKDNVLQGKLEPTPETRAAHDANVSLHRTWGFIGIGAGALIAGGGAAFLAVNASAKADARKELEAANTAKGEHTPPNCNIFNEFKGPVSSAAECNAYVADKESAYSDAKKKDVIGYVGVGVGAAVLVTGVVILLTGERANEYAALPSGPSQRPRLSCFFGPGNVGASLAGSF